MPGPNGFDATPDEIAAEARARAETRAPELTDAEQHALDAAEERKWEPPVPPRDAPFEPQAVPFKPLTPEAKAAAAAVATAAEQEAAASAAAAEAEGRAAAAAAERMAAAEAEAAAAAEREAQRYSFARPASTTNATAVGEAQRLALERDAMGLESPPPAAAAVAPAPEAALAAAPEAAPAPAAAAAAAVAAKAVGEFERNRLAVEAGVEAAKKVSDQNLAARLDARSRAKATAELQADIAEIRPGTSEGFAAITKLRSLVAGMKSGGPRDQAERLVDAVETAFNGVKNIANQPGVEQALTSAAAALTPSQKRTATLAALKAVEQERGQALRNEDAMIRNALALDSTTPITRRRRAEYAKLMATQTRESRPGTAVSLSDIVIGLDDAIGETETFFAQQPESPADKDFDSLDQISTKSFDYMQVFLNAAAQLPIAAPPPQPPQPVPAPAPEPPRATTPPGTVDHGLEQKLADLKHQLITVRARKAGLSSSKAGIQKTREIVALKQQIEELQREMGGGRRKTPRRRKTRNSTFRRSRKH